MANKSTISDLIIMFLLYNCRYMRELEETMNFTLCGLFLMLLITLCFVAFSAAMVKYYHRTMV
jgi:hypothetical protein